MTIHERSRYALRGLTAATLVLITLGYSGCTCGENPAEPLPCSTSPGANCGEAGGFGNTTGSSGDTAGAGGGVIATGPAGGAAGGCTTTGGSGGQGCANNGDDGIQVQRYEYFFDLATGMANSQIDMNDAAVNSGCIDLVCQVPVEKVSWNGADVVAAVANGLLQVCNDFAVCKASGRLSADTTVFEQPFDSGAGLVRVPDSHGNSTVYLRNWIEQCDLFGPCNDDTDVLSEFRLIVRHLPQTPVLCPGKLLQTSTGTECRIEGTLAPTYSSIFIASNASWIRNSYTKVGDVEVSFYETPQGTLAQSVEKVHLEGFISWITELFGAMPYGNDLRVAAMPMDWLGYEHPSNIVLNELLPTFPPDLSNTTMHVLMHEIVHQWAGNRTTLASPQDFAWKEAIADYLAYVYQDEKMPSQVSAKTREYWDRLARFASYHPMPFDMPAPPLLSLASSSYGTGAMAFFLQLEPFIGRPAIIQAIHQFLQNPGHRSIEQLQIALELSSGVDLAYYFNTWIRGSGEPEWPYFEVDMQQAANGLQLTVTQNTPSNKLYPCVLELELATIGAVTPMSVEFDVNAPSNPVSVVIPWSGALPSVQVDPQNKVINRKIPYSLQPIAPEQPPHIWLY